MFFVTGNNLSDYCKKKEEQEDYGKAVVFPDIFHFPELYLIQSQTLYQGELILNGMLLERYMKSNIMKQMPVDESLVVPLDYESKKLSPAFRQFKPVLYRSDEQFCCLLGPDTDKGIFACAATEEEAMKAWDLAFKERLQSKAEGDEVLTYIRDTMATSKKDVW